MAGRSVAGGGRAVEVGGERVAGWFGRFGERHGGVVSTVVGAEAVVVTAVDGSRARVVVPFAPMAETGEWPGLRVDGLVAHLLAPRVVGVVLVRLGGHSVGVVTGGKVVVSRTDRHQVHGRSAAGGWSQQRFARRREGQARQALAAAAKDVAEVLATRVGTLDAVVLGGDQRALEVLRAERILAPVFALAEPRVLDVPEPRRVVLDEVAERVMAVEIVIEES